MAEKIAIRIAAGRAIQIGEIVKPRTKRSARSRIIAELTKLKSPKVRIVTGSVSIESIGLTKAFNTPTIKATTIAVQKDST
ncbi:MAG: hypothetical protein UU19_C0002G0007 [Candidatus Curtissbacteria bacterium GW2011_GWD1_40_8]|nr:MAG: hypothetical protein UT95_C0044G0004 [Candidatus Curtissbacteria bacterium GW2011_GWB1_40_28]KKR60737.1 MAG: hypothetical protein UT99_C0008G0006 [Candidatus Curtissbacteria bacterium GW2011_GWA2_40_31]KKR61626.1 MAG: hypothetical protein UU00_C0010G0014 [Microgenomates group bacterium GW2011_GWC1_40_35]KKR77817.1 MAG: hypothetical protein UU19_C0002G0007 [Candidatus Curtissbacteria bacterium GW2011_GWD1_40_8]KKS01809.1 MAG: hypothetical protein UU53_C0007G0019 [Candidatus Curtissbacter